MAIGIAIRLRYLVVRLSVCINTWSLDDPVQQWILIEKKKLKWNYNKRHLKREEEEKKKNWKLLADTFWGRVFSNWLLSVQLLTCHVEHVAKKCPFWQWHIRLADKHTDRQIASHIDWHFTWENLCCYGQGKCKRKHKTKRNCMCQWQGVCGSTVSVCCLVCQSDEKDIKYSL